MGWLTDVYLVCAVVGGTILVLQTILMALGVSHGDHDFGHDLSHDVGHDMAHDGAHGPAHEAKDSFFLKWLSLKTIVACLTFFGLAGLTAEKAGLSPTVGLYVAILSGTAAIVVVGVLMTSLSKLQSAGNLDLANAVGLPAKVYLRVPAGHSGRGKVTLEMQGRVVEVEAVTAGPEIPIETDVRVVAVVSGDALEVAPSRS
jgi:hypothetical protein